MENCNGFYANFCCDQITPRALRRIKLFIVNEKQHKEVVETKQVQVCSLKIWVDTFLTRKSAEIRLSNYIELTPYKAFEKKGLWKFLEAHLIEVGLFSWRVLLVSFD